MAKRGRVPISDHLLKDALHMPSDTNITGATYDPEQRSVELFVEHESLHEVAEGTATPRYVPSITHSIEQFEWDWGSPRSEP